ncbi:sirohydrochlorin cobaltochelatase [Candidatus Magnetomoraceae bacterium gMMP-13]
MKNMKIPIVMAAFGTTTSALKTYSFIDKICKKHFPNHEILWSYSSRMIKDRMKKQHDIEIKHPYQVLEELWQKGYSRAVVQSMHLISGHEFFRLVDEIKNCKIRTSVGLPLLNSHEDYKAVIKAMEPYLNKYKSKKAIVLVGHGTDHPAWSSYPALHNMFLEKYESGFYAGMIEYGYPSMQDIIKTVKNDGFKQVCIIPFILVAGIHFQKDLAGKKDSWKAGFEKQGIEVTVESNGLGFNTGIVEIFCSHIEQALDVIPR